MKEIWKDIKGYEGYYQVSDLGRVRSLDRVVPHNLGKKERHIKSRIITPWEIPQGYLCVSLSKDGSVLKERISKLVAAAFLKDYVPSVFVDHINENRKDNRLSNLRTCNNGENMRNRGPQKNNKSGFKGVYQDKKSGKWISKINFESKAYHCGLYKNKEDAARAYDIKCLELHGEFAKTNEMLGLYES